MGASLHRMKADIVVTQKELAMKSRLADLKQKKRERDMQLSMQMAATRDRVWWFGTFYTVMGVVSFGRMAALRKFSPLPLNTIPFLAVPLWTGYMADFSYFNKADRINIEARVIREQEKHWFNEPLELPVYMQPYYTSMTKEANRKLEEAGLPPEKDWAIFGPSLFVEMAEDGSPVLTLDRVISILKAGPV